MIAFGWSKSDNRKLQQSFGMGRRDLFAQFIDLKKQAESMGCPADSLNLFTKILGFSLPTRDQACVLSSEP